MKKDTKLEKGFHIFGCSENENLVKLNKRAYFDLSCAIVLGLTEHIEYANGYWLKLDVTDDHGNVFVSYLREGF